MSVQIFLTYCHRHLSENPLWDGALDSLLQLLSTRSHQLHGNEYIRLCTTHVQYIFSLNPSSFRSTGEYFIVNCASTKTTSKH